MGILFGSTRNSGEGRADFEEEVLLVAVAVDKPLDDLNGVVDPLDHARVQRLPAAGNDAVPVGLQALGEH
ncbi:protein of unknown function (plasmid) [Cupriavidus taiwanensis]|uniref:Uncharacterized protein n=1 Tax=Cupriavidus taiwanensis TaxID=164546 RepID=A0A375FGQ0_9BURK|nr:protein of unknown function [Cupriavidus taiwanensis]SOZ72225.1 protein of unknown function [Cupriavidus taiwanensis]SOZ74529.1 protein of unknown function [Cupriavidus taiwanensis]SPA03453.1 protein of unknown function [Cupriavidus taiwanensis]SPA57193.1 protein of unknown function [Cupriavidus taiwanensis]